MSDFRRFVVTVCAAMALVACGDDGGGGGDDARPPGPDAAVADAAMADAADTADATMTDAEVPDAGPPVMSITEIIPSAASRNSTTELTVLGYNLEDGATLVLENCDTATQYQLDPVTVAGDGLSLTATLPADPTREQGLYSVTVTNPDSQSDVLECAFRVLASDPPTVTDVTPAHAYNGVPGDGVNSDQVVTISGTGFRSTPNVRLVKADNTVTYDALFVGFNSETEITAVVPSETLAMEAGDYHVHVINPDLLGAQWLVDEMGTPVPGIFEVTTTPPPVIIDIDPARIPNATCDQTMTITGTGFDPAATVWWVAPEGTTCAGSELDPNGNVLCPVVVDAATATEILAHFDPCPPNGAWPMMVRNPDTQYDIFFNVEVRPNNSGHLDASAFDVLTQTLDTARFKHGANFGFDSFGNAYLYAAAGQDAAGQVLDTVEYSQLDIFGNASPFAYARQYGGVQEPRVVNALNTPRQGATLVRVGRTMFLIGGAATSTDTTVTVDALTGVEVARILSYAEMPAIKLPGGLGGAGLPTGSWYYSVSAIGPWGESLGTREVVALNAGGQIEICWDAPQTAGATSYNVYRSLAADGRANSAALVAMEVAGPCFVDTGVEGLAPAPARLRGTVAAGTNLTAGEHVYRVSAHVPLTGGGSWETYASYAATLELTQTEIDAGNAAIALKWDPVPNATGYSLYKWNASAGEYFLLDTGGPLAATSFTDDGALEDLSAMTPRLEIASLPPGSLSVWSDTTAPDLGTAREGLDGVVIHMDPTTNPTGMVARILVAGGRTSNIAGAYLTTAESLAVYDDGTLGAQWDAETPEFTHARAFYSLMTTQNRNETPFPPPPEEPPCGDLDGDGYISCDCAPPGTPQDELDCNDADPNIHPGAVEICGDGIDQDCDMGCTGTDLPCECTDDLDGDGHISIECGGDDCCDSGDESVLGCSAGTAGGINPGEAEICDNGIDENCDGVDDTCDCSTDADGDGYISIECGGSDCCDTGTDTSIGCTDDTAGDINPGMMEICGNGIDEDCDGQLAVCRLLPGHQLPTVSPTTVRTLPREPMSRPAVREYTAVAGPSEYDVMYAVAGSEPVYVVAVLGDDEYAASNNSGRRDMEACPVDADTGMLACTEWTVQTGTTSQNSFGIDALLYFDYLYPFYGLSSETVDPLSRALQSSAINRFPVVDPTQVTGDQLIGSRQSANLSPTIARAYYQSIRLMSYIYLIGGWTDAGTAGTPGPTGTIERHLQ